MPSTPDMRRGFVAALVRRTACRSVPDGAHVREGFLTAAGASWLLRWAPTSFLEREGLTFYAVAEAREAELWAAPWSGGCPQRRLNG